MGVAGFVKLVKEYQAYAEVVHYGVSLIPSMVSQTRWNPPGSGCFRINTDAAVLGEEGTCMGWL